MDDRLTVERARRGDSGAFASLVRSNERSMYATAYGIVRSQWDASDAVQDAFAEAFAKIGTLREPEAFHAWLTRILVNKCNAMLRKRRGLVVTADPPEPEAFTYVGREEGMDLMAALQTLDAEHRQVVALRYFRDLKIDDIARVLGCPPGTVKSRLNRAVGKLGAAMAARDAAIAGGSYTEVAE